MLVTMLIRAARVSSQQLLSLLQPIGGRVPTTQAQYDILRNQLRSMGHVLENTPGNIAATLGAQHSRPYNTGTFIADRYDPAPTTEPNSNWNNWDNGNASSEGVPFATQPF